MSYSNGSCLAAFVKNPRRRHRRLTRQKCRLQTGFEEISVRPKTSGRPFPQTHPGVIFYAKSVPRTAHLYLRINYTRVGGPVSASP